MARFEFITIKITTGGAAFFDAPSTEVARVLRRLANDFETNGIPDQRLDDSTGKFCGEVQIVEAGE